MILSIEITHIRLNGGDGHEHIVNYKWRNPGDGSTGSPDKPTVIAWVDRGADRQLPTQ